jgi:hypothetical protein
MTDRKLLTSLSKLGFPMFEPSEELDVNETLAEVVKSLDTRQLTTKEQKDHFHQLMLLSGSLFSLYHLSFSWWNKLKKGLSKKDKALVKRWRNHLAHNRTLKCNDAELDPKRLKGLFELYFEKKAEKDRRRKEKYEEYSLEYALSQVFSPKQKELFNKKLEGLPLTKTEQEYYSRTVK